MKLTFLFDLIIHYNRYNQNSKIGQLEDHMYLQTYSFLFYFVRFLDPQLKKINVEFAGAMGANVKHEEGYLTGDLSQN
jgi:hypothetical protein